MNNVPDEVWGGKTRLGGILRGQLLFNSTKDRKL